MAIQEKNLVDLGRPIVLPNMPFPGAKDFQKFFLYTAGTIIFHDNLLYRARYNFRSGETFYIDDWEQLNDLTETNWGDIKGTLSEQADLQSEFDQTNNSINTVQNDVTALQGDFNAWIGKGGFLDAYNFGTSTPSQQQLTDYALSQITSAADPAQIWNGTKVRNLFDGVTWILTNTQDTNPPIFEWTNQGSIDILPFLKNTGGIIYGADPAVDPPGNVQALPNGKGNVTGVPYTFVIDSDDKLAAWANNTPGNDYSRILIKAGTWTLNTAKSGGNANTPMAIIDISNGRTKSVIGESGSKIVINNTASEMIHLCGIMGKVTGTNPNLVNPGGDYFFTNVTIEINNVTTYTGQYGALAASYGFYTCANLTNCTGTGNSSGAGIDGGASYGFHTCANLTNCTGTGNGTIGTTGSGSGYGFWGCINLTNCTGTGKGVAGYGTGYANGFSSCANLTNCIGTGITSGNGGHGFYSCRTGFGCKNGPTASTNDSFSSCYMEQSIGTTYAWANTAAGGYNLP